LIERYGLVCSFAHSSRDRGIEFFVKRAVICDDHGRAVARLDYQSWRVE
jgi:hypothetical protein